MAESDTWKGRENLENAKEAIEEFEKDIGETWKMQHGKSVKRECSNGENCQEDLRQRNYIDGRTNNMTKNTGEEQRKTGDDERVRNL